MARRHRFGWIAVAAALLSLRAQGKDLEIKSSWAATPPKVDGAAEEWAPFLRPLGEVPALVAVQNDADYVYLCIKTSAPGLKRQFARLGLTVWADATGKQQKIFGVRFPTGEPGGMRAGGQDRPSRFRDDSGGPSLDRLNKEFELIGPTAEDRLPVPLAEVGPVRAVVGDDSGVMVLEFRLPLKGSDAHPLAIGAVPEATISLGFETERPKREGGDRVRFGGAPGGEGGRGGFGGDGGRGGGRGIGRRGGGESEGVRVEASKPIKVWVRVGLARRRTPRRSSERGVARVARARR